jgi:hypothetical protein
VKSFPKLNFMIAALGLRWEVYLLKTVCLDGVEHSSVERFYTLCRVRRHAHFNPTVSAGVKKHSERIR